MDEQNQKRARSETQVGPKMALEEEKEREKGSKTKDAGGEMSRNCNSTLYIKDLRFF